MAPNKAEVRALVVMYDREMAGSASSSVSCPRGGTCECPQTRERIQKSTWEHLLPACSTKTCPALSLHELTE